MSSLRLSDRSFGTVGFVIEEAIDLPAIQQALSAALGMQFDFDSLDLTLIADPARVGALTAQGDINKFDEIVVGDYNFFRQDPFSTAPAPAIQGFDRMVFTDATIESIGLRDFGEVPAVQYELIIDRDPEFNGLGITDAYYGDQVYFDINGDVTEFDFSRVTADYPLYVEFYDDLEGVIYGGAASDILTGGNLTNILIGNDGDDFLNGWNGVNTLSGDAGNDVLWGGDDSDLAFGGDGNDALIGNAGQDSLFGGMGRDVLFGGSGSEFGLDDDLFGDAGDDVLFAGQGADDLEGGPGRDRFYFAQDYFFIVESEFDSRFVNTGFGISPTSTDFPEEDQSVLADFTAADDLLVFTVPDEYFNLSDGFINYDFITDEADATAGVPRSITFNRDSNVLQPPLDSFTLIDQSSGVEYSNILVAVEQSTVRQAQGLDVLLNVRIDGAEGFQVDASHEVIYQEANQSTLFLGEGLALDEIDIFYNVQFNAGLPESGILEGQDKFDLTAFGFSGGQVEAIIFSDIGSGPFLVDEIITLHNDMNPSNDIVGLVDFFADEISSVDRAVHVEYQYDGDGDDRFVVYADANHDGDYDVFNDLAFYIVNPLDADGSPYGTAYSPFETIQSSDLYSYDTSGEGASTGIFILTEDQNDLWYNNPVPVPPEPPLVTG